MYIGFFCCIRNDFGNMNEKINNLPGEEKPISDFWYGVQPVSNNIIRLRELFVDSYASGDSWLVVGSKWCLLADTCSGIVPLAPVIKSITSKPVLAVALNDFYDHAGGWSGFEYRACHRLDAPGLFDPSVEQDTVLNYLTDQRLFALPVKGYQLSDYHLSSAAPTRLLNDEEIIDLGDRKVQVLQTLGRGRGGISLFEEATGSLFTSDMLYDGEHGEAWPPTDPVRYTTSIKKFLHLPVTTVYAGHYGYFDRARMDVIINQQLADLAIYQPH